MTWSRRLLPSSVPQVLTIGDSAYIEDPRILIAKKPQDNVNFKFNLDYVGDQKNFFNLTRETLGLAAKDPRGVGV